MFFWKLKLFLIQLISFKASLQTCHRLINPNQSGIINDPKRIKERISKRTFSFTSSYYRASMCLEASLSVPIFLLFFVNVFSIAFLYMAYMEDMFRIHQQGKKAAGYAYVTEAVIEQDEIRLYKSRKTESPTPLFSTWDYQVYTKCVVKAWNGYDVTKKREDSSQSIVYVTEHGTVYHRNRSCNYLVLSIQPVAYGDISQKRNLSGECYYACSSCKNQPFVTLVYITDYGNRYHTTTKCQGLKRTVKSIPLSQVEDMDSCKKCG